MIEIEKLMFAYANEIKVINNLSIIVRQGEIVSFLGKSGCGKSTLLNLISGLLPIQEGSIEISNSEISYLTQKPTLLSYRNSYENALLGLELKNNTNTKSRTEIENLFSLFGLKDATLKHPNELSGGMKQRVGIIQSILVDADIYLLDEPFTAIDRNTLMDIENHLWNLFKTNGSTAILVNHDLEQAVSFSDRIIMLSSNPGTIVYDQTFPSDFIKLRPSERKNSLHYSEYLFEVVKRFSEL
ncbi:Taurine import ATP-binding protein TauB [bioreactor metagenome]|uniref:Taurine import ATP-binding protein TauB n=1 Tax=bioreactor metagenome TaxID=1076179 RepID=A0A645CIJ3_9ZZZZ|nr:ATP-binding cassette domain-containing protein [Rikenellaceae bacterium]